MERELSERTKAEMRAGAAALAEQQGRPLDPDYLERCLRTQQRMKALRDWEAKGLVTIEQTTSYDMPRNMTNYKIIHHVKNGPSFTDHELAHYSGDYPSEVLIANIALALSALGVDRG